MFDVLQGGRTHQSGEALDVKERGAGKLMTEKKI